VALGVLLAFVQIELLLQADLRVFGSSEGGHRCFELLAARLAYCDYRSCAEPSRHPQCTLCHVSDEIISAASYTLCASMSALVNEPRDDFCIRRNRVSSDVPTCSAISRQLLPCLRSAATS
jgi:hypothetical protein